MVFLFWYCSFGISRAIMVYVKVSKVCTIMDIYVYICIVAVYVPSTYVIYYPLNSVSYLSIVSRAFAEYHSNVFKFG